MVKYYLKWLLFLIFGTWDENSGKWRILDVFGVKSEENEKIKKLSWKIHLTMSHFTR